MQLHHSTRPSDIAIHRVLHSDGLTTFLGISEQDFPQISRLQWKAKDYENFHSGLFLGKSNKSF